MHSSQEGRRVSHNNSSENVTIRLINLTLAIDRFGGQDQPVLFDHRNVAMRMPLAGRLFNPKMDEHVIVTEDYSAAATGPHGGVRYGN